MNEINDTDDSLHEKIKILSSFVEHKPKMTYIIKCDSDEKGMILTKTCKHFVDDKHNVSISMDMEFHFNKIKLIQVEFYFVNESYNIIFIINPFVLKTTHMSIFIKMILTNKSITKIMHGSESLDIPNLHKYIFKNDKKMMRRFLKNFVDTVFLCEYNKVAGLAPGPKCSLYNALLNYDCISEPEYNELLEIEKNMGPIQFVDWRLDKIQDNSLKYAYFDVVYLENLFNNIVTKSNDDIKYIYSITQIVLLIKRQCLDINDCLQFVNENNNQTNHELFITFLKQENNKLYKTMSMIGYFKATLFTFYKYLFYSKLINKLSENKHNVFDKFESKRLTRFFNNYVNNCELYINEQ